MLPAIYQDVDKKDQPENGEPASPTKKGSPRIVYDEILVHEFKQVPLTSRDENEWYGPWNSLLHRLFPPQEGFQTAPQYQRAQLPGGPEWSVYFLIKYRGHVIACITEIKPLCHYQYPRLRISAYEQLQNRLEMCVEDRPSEDVSAIYGLSCLGPRFMIMKLSMRTGQIQPNLYTDTPQGVTKAAPQKWWSHHVLKQKGCLILHRLAAEVRKSLNPKHELLVNHPVSAESLPDDDSDFEVAWEDETDETQV